MCLYYFPSSDSTQRQLQAVEQQEPVSDDQLCGEQAGEGRAQCRAYDTPGEDRLCQVPHSPAAASGCHR